MNRLGDFIRKRRNKLNLTLRQLASISNVDHSHIAKIERDEKIPNESTLLRLAKALKLSHKEVEKLFTPKEIVELTLAIVAINSWNRLAVGFRSEVGNYISRYKKINE